MDENTQAKFAEKVKELLNMAKKKKNVLEYQEISDFFADMPLEEEQMEKVLEYLDQNTWMYCVLPMTMMWTMRRSF